MAPVGVPPMSHEEELTKPFLEFWIGYLDRLDEPTRKLLETFTGTSDLRKSSPELLEAAGKSMEAYMRSPAFLQAMKQGIDKMIQTKRQMDALNPEIAAQLGLATACEFHQLADRFKHAEKSLTSRLRDIEIRLAAIERKQREADAKETDKTE
jgi:hypothetical protein